MNNKAIKLCQEVMVVCY